MVDVMDKAMVRSIRGINLPLEIIELIAMTSTAIQIRMTRVRARAARMIQKVSRGYLPRQLWRFDKNYRDDIVASDWQRLNYRRDMIRSYDFNDFMNNAMISGVVHPAEDFRRMRDHFCTLIV